MKRNRKARRLALVVLTLVVAGACSSPQGTEADNSLLGKKKNEGRRDGGKAPGDRKDAPDDKKGPGGKPKTEGGAAVPSVVPTIGSAEGEAPPVNSGAAKTDTKTTATGTDPRTASMVVTEPDPDQEKSGLVPEYSDIVSVRVEGLGDSGVRFTLTFRGTVPQKMPDDKTVMVAGIGVTDMKEENGRAFGASANESGWQAYGGGKDKSGKYPGELSVQGTDIVFTLPWSAVGGVKPFKWYAQATWFKSLAGTTHYSLDILPNDGPARFPAG